MIYDNITFSASANQPETKPSIVFTVEVVQRSDSQSFGMNPSGRQNGAVEGCHSYSPEMKEKYGI
jgi:hypothetical protein